jgi:hypothetical protein
MEDFDFYPEKPSLEEKKSEGGLSATVLSIIVFVISFLLFFSEEMSFLFNILVVLIIHELGHFITMKYFNYRNVKMLFVPLMGAFVQGNKDEYSQKETMYVVGAGPFPGVLLGVLFLVLSVQFQERWMVDLGLMFLLLNLLNLLPIEPLDGGQLFKKRNVPFVTSYKNLTNKNYIQIKEVLLEQSSTLNKVKDMMPEEDLDPIMAEQVNGVLISPMHYDASLIMKIIIFLSWIVCLSLVVILPLLFLSNTLWLEYFDWYLNEVSFK